METLLSRDWKDRRDRLNASELLGEVKGETAVIHRLPPNNISFLLKCALVHKSKSIGWWRYGQLGDGPGRSEFNEWNGGVIYCIY